MSNIKTWKSLPLQGSNFIANIQPHTRLFAAGKIAHIFAIICIINAEQEILFFYAEYTKSFTLY